MRERPGRARELGGREEGLVVDVAGLDQLELLAQPHMEESRPCSRRGVARAQEEGRDGIGREERAKRPGSLWQPVQPGGEREVVDLVSCMRLGRRS